MLMKCKFFLFSNLLVLLLSNCGLKSFSALQCAERDKEFQLIGGDSVEVLSMVTTSNRWLESCWDWRLQPIECTLDIVLNNGNRYSIPFDYINEGGFYLRPYAGIVALSGSAYTAEDRIKSSIEVRRVERSRRWQADPLDWGVKASDFVYVVTFETDIMILPGARVPEMLLNPYNSGIRSSSLPVNMNYLEFWLLGAHGDLHAFKPRNSSRVCLVIAEDGRLIREIVNITIDDKPAFASHVFDFIYKPEGIPTNNSPHSAPSRILLKIWPYDKLRDMIASAPFTKGPGGYGVSYKYSIDISHSELSQFFVYKVLVIDDPQKHRFDETILDHLDSDLVPCELTISIVKAKEMAYEKVYPASIFRILQSIY